MGKVGVVLLCFCLLGSASVGRAGGAFDEFLRLNQNSFPASFDQIIASIVGGTPEEPFPKSGGSVLLIPESRSLQKDFSNYTEPRIILAGRDNLQPLFFGFAPQAKQVEVISWNSAKGEFDYLLIKNYVLGQKLTIEAAPRAVCLSCHQNGGPLFSRFPWREMARNPDALKSPVDLIREARNQVTSYFGLDLNQYDDAAFGLADSFDGRVRLASRQLQSAQVFKEVCGTSFQCRRLLLEAALAYSDKQEPGDSFLKALDNVIKPLWPADGFAYVSSVLPDRFASHLTDDRVPQGFWLPALQFSNGEVVLPTYLEDITSQSFFLTKDPITHASMESVSGKMTNDQTPFLKPQYLRPKVSGIPVASATNYLVGVASSALGLKAADTAVLSHYNPSEIHAALEKQNIKPFVTNWPPSRYKLMAAVLRNLQNRRAAQKYERLAARDDLNYRSSF